MPTALYSRSDHEPSSLAPTHTERLQECQVFDFVDLTEGFRLSRVQGSHHIFVHPVVAELVNVQNVGGQAKPYQVRQVLKLVEHYHLRLSDDTDEPEVSP